MTAAPHGFKRSFVAFCVTDDHIAEAARTMV
jgi:hypothetical protein